MGTKSIAVIGAGPSGLVTAKELLQEGHDVVCFERRADIGGVFLFSEDPDAVGVWATCRLTSSELVTSFSDHFPGCGSGEPYQHRQLTHREYHDYLVGYAERFGVLDHLRFSHEVVRVAPNGSTWRVKVRDLQCGTESTHEVDAVAVCTGIHQVPAIPALPGLERFRGQVLHSAHYKSPETIRGQSAVFIGAGESGGDIIGEASRHLERAYLSLRRGVFVLPRLLNGFPNDYTGTRLLYSLPEFASRRSDPEARRMRRRLGWVLAPATAARAGLDAAQHLVQSIRRHGTAPALRTDVQALIDQLRVSSGGNQFEAFATKTESFVDAIVDGHCELRPGVREVTGNGVVFVDGQHVDVEAIVFCTGFQPPSAPFVDVPVRLDRLYRSCFDPSYGETLAFIGFVRPPIGAIPPMSEMQARWFAQLISGRVHLPPSSEMESEIEEALRRRRGYHSAVFDRIPNLVDYSTYMDSLAEIVGCKPRLADLVRSPLLLYKVYTTAFSGAQFRLRGPYADPELARAVLKHAHSHVRVVRFFDLAAAELARIVGLRHLEPRLTLIGHISEARKRVG
jgi:dimethylaniline monooxygenase (N-oxide forming)